MEDLVEAYHRDYKGWIVHMLMVSGLWPDELKQSKILRIFLVAIALLVLTILQAAVLNFTIHNSRNIIGLVAGIGSITGYGTVCLKIIVMLLQQRDVKFLKDGLLALFENDLEVPKNRGHLLAYYHAYNRFSKCHFVSCAGFVVFIICTTLMAALHGKYVRMFAIRAPFEVVPGGSLHWMIFGFEVMSGTYLATNSFGIDNLFGLFSLHMVGELRLLSHRFRNLKPGGNYRSKLKDCIDRHCLLIDYKYTMDRLFGLMSVYLALSSAVIICSIIFQITQSKNISLFKLIFAIDYILSKFLQAYIYAWYGNTIAVESERCVESIYHSEWVECQDLRLMKDVVFIRAQSPIHINAMGIMIVRLDMFIKIAHATISYFCLLKTIEEKIALPN